MENPGKRFRKVHFTQNEQGKIITQRHTGTTEQPYRRFSTIGHTNITPDRINALHGVLWGVESREKMESSKILREFKEIFPESDATALENVVSAVDNIVTEKVDIFFSLSAIQAIRAANDRQEIEAAIAYVQEKGIDNAIMHYATEPEREKISKANETMRIAEIFNSLPAGNGLTLTNSTPLKKSLVKQEYGIVNFGTNSKDVPTSTMRLIGGKLGYTECCMLDCLHEFKRDSKRKITVMGKTYFFFSLAELYRAMRGGRKVRPTNEQQQELLKRLRDLSSDDRKIDFKLNDVMREKLGFDTFGGEFRFLTGFDKVYWSYRGQETTVILYDYEQTYFHIAERYRMIEEHKETLRDVQKYVYTLTLKNPIQIKGANCKRRTFKSNEERIAFCRKHGITRENIEDFGEKHTNYTLNDNSLAIREALLDFVMRYIRARYAIPPKPYSNRKPYADIFKECGIAVDTREQRKRATDDIRIILDHFKKCGDLPELKNWQPYKNRGSRANDGIEIFVERPDGESEE